MSAVVCGTKRSFFEELPPSPPISKRLRCASSSSPIRFSAPSHINQLRDLFPLMDLQLLERVLQDCGNDIDAAIKSLRDLSLGYIGEVPVNAGEPETNLDQGSFVSNRDGAASKNAPTPNNISLDGREWVDLFVREMLSATSVDDARSRAARALEVLEKSITTSVGERDDAATKNLQKENVQLKEQIEILLQENILLKRAVSIQHERQKEYDHKNLELQQLKQLVSQYQQQLRTLEVNNYALTMHLKQSQQSSSIPGRFHPDVF